MEIYNKKEIQERVKNYIENLLLHIELEENDFFMKKYEKLQELIPEISLKELGEDIVQNYKIIVKHYNDNFSHSARLEGMKNAYNRFGNKNIF